VRDAKENINPNNKKMLFSVIESELNID